MPKEVSVDPEFNELLQGQIISATSVDQNYYSWKDPHFTTAMNQLPLIKQRLADLTAAVNAAKARAPASSQNEFDDCLDNTGAAEFDVTDIQSAKDFRQYGSVSSLTRY